MRPLTYLIALLLPLCALQAQTPSDFSPLADIVQANDLLASAAIVSIQVDANGDVYYAGSVPSPAGLAGAKMIGTASGNIDLFVLKMDSTLQRVLFATVIGGSLEDRVQTMKVDSSGSVYLTGYSFSADFPYTNHLQAPSAEGSFVVKLSAAGDSLIYATQLGQMDAVALDVDAAGSAFVGGNAAGDKIPSTPGAYRPARATGSAPYVVKLAANGVAAAFSTYVGDASSVLRGISARSDGSLVFLTSQELSTLNATGSGLLSTTPLSFPQTGGYDADTLSADASGNFYVSVSSVADGYTVYKFSPSGTLVSTLHGNRLLTDTHTWISPQGQTYVNGSASGSGAFFPTHNTFEPCAANKKLPQGTAGSTPIPLLDRGLVVYQPDGEMLLSSFFATELGTAAFSPDGRYLYASVRQARYAGNSFAYGTGVLRFDLSRLPAQNRLAPSCLAHGATYVQAPTAPGEIMTIYGSNLGPATGVSYILRNGLVPTDLAGTSLFVDRKPAPVLYVQDAQINFVVPWSTKTTGVTSVCIARNGEAACLDATADLLTPGAFRSGDSAIIVHQDGTLNSRTNPLSRGHYVSLYLTGTGTLDGPLVDGAISGFPLQHTTANVTASITGDVDHSSGCTGFSGTMRCPDPPQFPVPVTYAGSAPTLVSGMTQVNLLIPDNIPLGSRALTVKFTDGMAVGGISVEIWIAP